jgi:hypothetical protein
VPKRPDPLRPVKGDLAVTKMEKRAPGGSADVKYDSSTRKLQAACQFAISAGRPLCGSVRGNIIFEPVRNQMHRGHISKSQFFTYCRSQQTRNQRPKAMLEAW